MRYFFVISFTACKSALIITYYTDKTCILQPNYHHFITNFISHINSCETTVWETCFMPAPESTFAHVQFYGLNNWWRRQIKKVSETMHEIACVPFMACVFLHCTCSVCLNIQASWWCAGFCLPITWSLILLIFILQVGCCVPLHPLGGAEHKRTPFPNPCW